VSKSSGRPGPRTSVSCSSGLPCMAGARHRRDCSDTVSTTIVRAPFALNAAKPWTTCSWDASISMRFGSNFSGNADGRSSPLRRTMILLPGGFVHGKGFPWLAARLSTPSSFRRLGPFGCSVTTRYIQEWQCPASTFGGLHLVSS
jgi:hypothetical protein